MEYIEPKPKEEKPHAKRNKIILISSICGALALSLAVGSYFLISKVFLNYNNIEIYTFNYDNSDPKSEARISAVKEEAKLPKRLRVPAKFKGHPVTAIDDEVFSKREELVKIILPNSLKSIGNSCFAECKNLSQINVPKNLEVVGTDAFYGTAWLDSMPDNSPVVFGSWLYTYKGQMSANSAVLKSEDSPNASKYSGDKVYLNNYKNISRGVFKNQKNLVFAELPDDFSSIPQSLFDGCSKLYEVDLPKSLKTIEDFAFRKCTSLEFNDFVDLKDLTSIGNYSFASTSIPGELSFADALHDVGVGAFELCGSITKVNVGSGFEYIPDHAFTECESLVEVSFPAREFTADSHLSYIGEHAFEATAISEFKVPFNVSDVRMYAFAECDNLTGLYVYNNLTGTKRNVYNADSDSWSQTDSAYQGVTKFGVYMFYQSENFKEMRLVDVNNNPTSAADEVNLPVSTKTFGGYNDDAFMFQSTAVETLRLGLDFTSIPSGDYKDSVSKGALSVLPPSLAENARHLAVLDFGGDKATITKINRNAFKGCVKLTSVELPSSLKDIQPSAFENCELLGNVILSPNALSIAESAFAGCTSIENIVVPKGYKSIAENAFSGCENLTTITFEADSNMTNILASSFLNCKKLTAFETPDTVRQYGKKVFMGCEKLSTVTLSTHSSNTKITEQMFSGAKALEDLVIPSNFRSIDSKAFENCTALNTLTVECTIAKVTLQSNSFSGAKKLSKLYVPSSLLSQYKADSKWTAAVEGGADNIVAIA